MPLKLFDTTDAIPEPLREHAIETKDGKFAVAEDEDVSGIKSKNEQLLGETKKERAARQKAEKELADIRAEREAAAAGMKPEELQKLRATIEAEGKAKLDAAEKQIHELTFGSQLDAALSAAGVVDLQDGRLVLGSRFEMVDGKLAPKDDKSVTAQAFIESRLRAEKPHLFKGTQAAGGGAGGSRGAGASGAKTPTQMTSDERRAFIETNGEAAFYDALTKEQTATLTKKVAA